MKYTLGLIVFIVLLALLILGSMRYGLGRLPGDIAVNRENFSFYLPVTTMILVSILLSLAFLLFAR